MKIIEITGPTKITSRCDCTVTTQEKDGVRVTLYEHIKAGLDIGKWYKSNINTIALIVSKDLIVGFSPSGEWFEVENKLNGWEHQWQLADMKEVVHLLIRKALDDYPNGTRYNDSDPRGRELCGENMGLSKELFDSNKYGIFTNNHFVFSFETGKWADIKKESSRYIIKITEMTKPFPKSTYYKCEIGATLQDTVNDKEAFVFECKEAAENIAEFIDERYDFRSTIIEL